MLEQIGVDSIAALFAEIPAELRMDGAPSLQSGEALSEMAMLRWMGERAEQDAGLICFAGAGCYDHHVPAAVWDIAGRGEFMTAYTPYQAEASQGTLQLVFEYQTMMCELTAMDASNASVYDGASGLAEAILMAVRKVARKSRSRRVLMAETLHPHYRDAACNIVANQGVEIETLPMDGAIAILIACRTMAPLPRWCFSSPTSSVCSRTPTA